MVVMAKNDAIKKDVQQSFLPEKIGTRMIMNELDLRNTMP